MNYDPRTGEHNLAHNPFTSLVVPRPIGWISTCNADGTVNLAPYSFFNAVSGRPPMIMFSSAERKHSQINAETQGEFVANLATYDLRAEVNLTSAVVPEDVSEPDFAKLEMAPSKVVRPPRVARAPAALECRYVQTVRLKGADGQQFQGSIIIGQVVNIFIDDAVIENGMIDILKIRPLSRLGYMDYATVHDVFAMERPAPIPAVVEAG
ncbi:MAG: flavin reductase family protein [Hyphomicrobiales bacterium]|nr:flavin reductase family protein [Hyphomicrobiales bacterium]